MLEFHRAQTTKALAFHLVLKMGMRALDGELFVRMVFSSLCILKSVEQTNITVE